MKSLFAISVLLISILSFASDKIEKKIRKPNQASEVIISDSKAEKVTRAIWESDEAVLDLCQATHSCSLITKCDYDRDSKDKFKCTVSPAK